MIRIATISIQAVRPGEVARFWRDLLGYEVAPNHTDPVLLVGDGPSLLVQLAECAPGDGAIHLDLRPLDAPAAVARALELGASLADIGQSGRECWTVLRDPGGNLFCILRSVSDHADLMASDPGSPTPIPGA